MSQNYSEIPLRTHRPRPAADLTTTPPQRVRNTDEDEAISTYPRSALRYRPIASDLAGTQAGTYVIQRGKQQIVIHTDVPQAARQQRRQTPTPQPVYEDTSLGSSIKWYAGRVLLFFGILSIIMLLGFIVISWIGSAYTTWQDDLHYGRPRTFQIDYVVGHNDSAAHPSHFIAINRNKRIEIIEFPGGDSTKAKIFYGPTLIGDNANLLPVTLSFKDVNGDGKPDLIISVGDNRYVFINDNGSFRPLKPGESISL